VSRRVFDDCIFDKNSNQGHTRTIEIDFLAHTPTVPCKRSFGSRISVVSCTSLSSSLPCSSSSSSSLPAVHISPFRAKKPDHIVDIDVNLDEPVFYVVFEITRGESKNIEEEKMRQLERDLNFLKMRQEATTVLDCVAYAGLALSHDGGIVKVSELLAEHPHKYPLLSELCSMQRLLVFTGPVSLFETISLTSSASTSTAIVAEQLKREEMKTIAECKREEMKTIAEMKREDLKTLMEFIAAAQAIGDTELANKLTLQLKSTSMSASCETAGFVPHSDQQRKPVVKLPRRNRGGKRGRGHGRGRGR
jgi:hypothetical protein